MAATKQQYYQKGRVFSRGGRGGDGVPPQILGGNASPPGGGRILTWEKKDMGVVGVTRTDPHLGHHVRNPHQKKKGRQGVERARSASSPFLASL